MVKKNDAVMICPNCGSTNIETDFSNPLVWAYGLPSNHKCNNCGHLGKFFPQIDRDRVKEYQSKVEEEKRKVNRK